MTRDVDFRNVYPAIRVPTLVLYRNYRPGAADIYRRVANLIPDARAVELPGADYMGIFLHEPARAIESFLASVPHHPEPDRMLLTVFFTDVVGSTERLAHLGDAGWRALVERHHELVRRLLTRFRGREVDTAGDGFSPCSTGRRVQFAVRVQFTKGSLRWESRRVPVSTRASAR